MRAMLSPEVSVPRDMPLASKIVVICKIGQCVHEVRWQGGCGRACPYHHKRTYARTLKSSECVMLRRFQKYSWYSASCIVKSLGVRPAAFISLASILPV